MKIINIRENNSLQTVLYPFYSDYINKDYHEAEAYVQKKMCENNREIFLFEDKGRYVGFAEVFITQECFPDEDLPEICMKIVSFYIAPKFRRQHLGSYYLKELRSWAHEKEVAIIEIEIQPDNAVATLFLNHSGFEITGSGKRNCYRLII